jgi:WD40 repeat protein
MTQERIPSTTTKNECLQFELKGSVGDQVSCLTVDKRINPDRIVAGSENGQVRIYDLQTRKIIKGLSLRGCVNSVQFSKESTSNELLYVASGNTVSVFDLRTQKSFKQFRQKHSNIAQCISFRPKSGWELFSGSFDTKVYQWDFSRGSVLNEFSASVSETDKMTMNPAFVYCLEISEDGKQVYSGRGDGSIQVLKSMGRKGKQEIWDASLLSVPEAHTWSVTSLALDDQYLVSGSLDKTIQLWHVKDDQKLCKIETMATGCKVNAIELFKTQDKTFVAVAGYSDNQSENGMTHVVSFRSNSTTSI